MREALGASTLTFERQYGALSDINLCRMFSFP